MSSAKSAVLFFYCENFEIPIQLQPWLPAPPQYGKIRDPQLDKGDFVFVTGKAQQTTPQPIVLPEQTRELDINAYERERDRLAAAKQQWADWQAKMSHDYDKISGLDSDENLPSNSKRKLWNDFLQNYDTDNPYSQEDEDLRSKARKRITYWDSYQPPAPSSIPVSSDDMVYIPGGTFMMGSNDGGDDEKPVPEVSISTWSELGEIVKKFKKDTDEKPVHKVSLRDFYMDKYEVTNAQFKKFVDANPQWSKSRISSQYQDNNYLKHWNGNNYPAGKGDHPVVYMSWYAANAYAEWAGKRLPTEAEWEYAARGELDGKKYPWGDMASQSKANYSSSGTKPVGSYLPNGYGLYDMAGNVWEWCADWYNSDYYSQSSFENPQGPSGGKYRVFRGGGWDTAAATCVVVVATATTRTSASTISGFVVRVSL